MANQPQKSLWKYGLFAGVGLSALFTLALCRNDDTAVIPPPTGPEQENPVLTPPAPSPVPQPDRDEGPRQPYIPEPQPHPNPPPVDERPAPPQATTPDIRDNGDVSAYFRASREQTFAALDALKDAHAALPPLDDGACYTLANDVTLTLMAGTDFERSASFFAVRTAMAAGLADDPAYYEDVRALGNAFPDNQGLIETPVNVGCYDSHSTARTEARRLNNIFGRALLGQHELDLRAPVEALRRYRLENGLTDGP